MQFSEYKFIIVERTMGELVKEEGRKNKPHRNSLRGLIIKKKMKLI
jgi:hypothetical protein